MEKKSIISNVGRKGSFLHRTLDRVYIEYINLWRTDKESNIYKLYSTHISDLRLFNVQKYIYHEHL